jgi:hypothetical protein
LSHAHGRKDIDINVIKLIVAILFAILPMRWKINLRKLCTGKSQMTYNTVRLRGQKLVDGHKIKH